MEKSTIYVLLSIIKLLVMVVGVGFTVVNVIPGISNADKGKIKRAAFIFIGTFLGVLVISIIEMFIATH